MDFVNKYDWIGEYHQGVAIVKKNEKFGAIMVGGKEIVSPVYDALSNFEGGYATATYNKETRIINLSGQVQVNMGDKLIFLPMQYDWGSDFENDICIIVKNGKLGILSKDLCEIIEPSYDSIDRLNSKIVVAFKNLEKFIVDIGNSICYKVKESVVDNKGDFLYAVVSLVGDNRQGVLDSKSNLIVPIVFDNISIKGRNFFVISNKEEGIGVNTVHGELIKRGRCDTIEVLDDNFIVARKRDRDTHRVKDTYLCNVDGCICHFKDQTYFRIEADRSVRFGHFKLSPRGELRYINYGPNREEQYIVAPNFVDYEYIEPFHDDLFIVGQVDKNGYLRFGVVDSKGVVILPSEYSRLKILSKDFIAYSTDNENILDLKNDYKDKDLQWILYHTDYGRFGDKLRVLSFGILNSEWNIICSPKYRNIKVIQVQDSSYFFQVSNSGSGWGIIDISDNIVLPIKFNTISFTKERVEYNSIHNNSVVNVDSLSGFASIGPSWNSEKKGNEFDELGMFIIPTPDGKIVHVSSESFDWCDSFNASGWAQVTKGGLSGKINSKGELISLNGEEMTVVPEDIDWAYDFHFGYALINKNGKWGVANKDWKKIIPCIYDSIEPICEGFYKYKETTSAALAVDNNGSEGTQELYNFQTPQYKYGIVNIDNVEIIKAEYNNVWPVEGSFFKIERVVENSVREHDRYGIIDRKGDFVIQPNYEEVTLVKIEEKEFWIVTQNRKKGVLYTGINLILTIFDDIIVEDGIFVCKANTYSKDNGLLVKYNVNGEILIDCKNHNYIVPAEYDVAYHLDYGLIRVVKEGKWGIINTINDVVVPPSLSYIDTFDGQFAKVGNTENDEYIYFPDNIGWHVKNMKYGLIDTLGDIVLPLEYDYISKWDNGFYLVMKDDNYILLSPSLHPIIKTDKSLEKLDDKYILKVDSSGFRGYRYGLLDYYGNEIIALDEEHGFSQIEVLENGLLKVFYYKGEYGNSHIGILNNQGKTLFEKHSYCDDIILSDFGLFLVKCDNYGSPTTYSLVNLQGKEIFPESYYEIKFIKDGILSIENYRGWGLADIKGNIIIAPNYLDELVFEDDIANIKVKGASSIQKINKNGIVIVHNEKKEVKLPESVYWGTDFINRVSIVRGKGGGYDVIGVVDIKGNVIIPTRYKSVSLLSDKTICVQDGDCYGIFDLKGNVIFPSIFTSIEYINDDRIKVTWNLKTAKEWNNKCDYVGEKYKGYDNKYLVDNRSALCNYKGEIINDKSFIGVGKIVDQYAYVYKEKKLEQEEDNGLIREKIKYGQIGIIDLSGNIIIDPIYDSVILYEGTLYAKVRKDGKYGIIHIPSGSIHIFENIEVKYMWDIDQYGRCIYSDECWYDDSSDKWKYSGRLGVLSIKGVVIPLGKYDNINLLDNGLIEVSNESKDLYGLSDKNGNIILPVKYSYISKFKGQFATICLGGKRDDECSYKVRGGKWGVIDCTGKFIKECVSDDEEFLEEKESDNKRTDNNVQFEKPSVILSDRIPEPKERNSYDYGYDSYYDDDDGGP